MEGVMVVVRKADKYLLGTESKKSPITGKWRLLGGKVEEGETPLETVSRELMEEAGISVKVIRRLCDKEGDHRPITIHIYYAQFLSGLLAPNENEIGELRFFSYDEVMGLDTDILTKSVFRQFPDQIKD